MLTSISCSWCHTMNPTTERHCSHCGHDAHRARLDCRCPQCQQGQQAITYLPAYAVGERVIFTCGDATLDGLRGVITACHAGGYYDVAFDDGRVWERVWESKLDKESEHPDYSRPKAGVIP